MTRIPSTSISFARVSALVLALTAFSLPMLAQEVGKHDIRYRIEYNLDRFPQKTPQEALASVVRAISEKKFEYLLAQLSLPSQVDPSVLRIASTFPKGTLEDKKLIAFQEVVKETEEHFLKDPLLLKELRQFLSGAVWDEKGHATHKDLPGRKVTFHKLENRWFLDRRQK